MLAAFRQSVQIVPRHIGLAPLHGQRSVQDSHEGGFSRSGRAAQKNKLSLFHGEVHVLQGHLPPEGIGQS